MEDIMKHHASWSNRAVCAKERLVQVLVVWLRVRLTEARANDLCLRQYSSIYWKSCRLHPAVSSDGMRDQLWGEVGHNTFVVVIVEHELYEVLYLMRSDATTIRQIAFILIATGIQTARSLRVSKEVDTTDRRETDRFKFHTSDMLRQLIELQPAPSCVRTLSILRLVEA
jgi:hypothetical protein